MRAPRHAAADNPPDQLNQSFASKDCTLRREQRNTKSMWWMSACYIKRPRVLLLQSPGPRPISRQVTTKDQLCCWFLLLINCWPWAG